MKGYQNVEFKKKYSIELLKGFLKNSQKRKEVEKNLKIKKYKMQNILFMKTYFKKV